MNYTDTINEILTNIFGFIKIDPDWEINKIKDPRDEKDGYEILIEGNNLNFLIGYQGQSLDALQTIVGQILYRNTGEAVPISLDINGYKKSRIEKIQEITKTLIDKVRFFKKEIQMRPMDAWERRQVHMFVTEYDDIQTESIGEGKERRIVLKLK